MLEWSIDYTFCSDYTTYTQVTSKLNTFYAFLLFLQQPHALKSMATQNTHKKAASNLMGLKLVLQFADLNPNKQLQFFKLWLFMLC